MSVSEESAVRQGASRPRVSALTAILRRIVLVSIIEKGPGALMSKRSAISVERTEPTGQDRGALALLTARIVSAYVQHNRVAPVDLSPAIASVHGVLSGLGREPVSWFPDKPVKRKPAVSKRMSVTAELVVCLECGRAMKTLKRHLLATHKKTPAQYRADWSLPSDHPMIAPAYQAVRSQMAKDRKLGVKEPERTNAPTRAAYRAANKLGNKRARLARKTVNVDRASVPGPIR